MRGAWIVGWVLVLAAGTARAGVYSTSDPWLGPKADTREFLLLRANIRGAGVEVANRFAHACWTVASPTSPLPALVNLLPQPAVLPEGRTAGWGTLVRVGALEEKRRRGMLFLNDTIDLGAGYLRLAQYRKAIQLLEPAVREFRHFMLTANLAAAYEGEGILERAESYRQLALSQWPEVVPGWDGGLVAFSKRAETVQLHLTRLRLAEQRRGGRGIVEGVDALFPRVRFVGPSGAYEPGTIAPAMLLELPADAVDVVMQLVLWLPFDDRIFWLFGELLNARGEVPEAAAVLKEVAERGADARSLGGGGSLELRRHAQALARAVDLATQLREKVLTENDPLLMLRYPFALKPRGLPGSGPIGDLAAATELQAALAALQDRRARGALPAATLPPAPTPDWMPNGRHLGVAFGAGMLVMFLVGRQLRQIRQARQARRDLTPAGDARAA